MQKKLKIGWFSFSCCEDNTIIFTELLNDYYEKWSKLVEFQHIRVLKKETKLKPMDVAFIEGAIASEKDAKKLRKIRNLSKKIVAVGSCAATGMPSAQRNTFDQKRKKEIEFLIERFHMARKVRKVSNVVKVDHIVPGCPMKESDFIKTLNKCLKEFKIK